MATGLTNFWLKFFKDAGILNTTSTAVYATTFAENEIQKDMIVDLTREILRELDITTMGHVLAILKHAKTVHNQTLNETIVAKTNPVVEPKLPISQARSPAKSSPMSRMIEYYVKPSEYEPIEVKPVVAPKLVPKVTPKLADRLGEVVLRPTATTSLKVTDRLGILKPATVTKRKSNVISLKPKQLAEELPVKRIRQVLPEEEGGYKITMPRGITPRTKQILAKQNNLKEGKPKTVFERLGEGSVSSTTCVDEPKISKPVSSAPKASGPSVFLRLGGKKEVTSTVTSETQESEEPVGYFGVLKKTVSFGAQKSQLNLKTRPWNSTKPFIKVEPEDMEHSMPATLRTQKVEFNPSALSRPGTSSEAVKSDSKVVKKKFIKTLANGKRVIVMREVIEEVKKSQQSSAAKKAVSFGTNNFRSDNISKKADISSRLGEEEQEQEWDY